MKVTEDFVKDYAPVYYDYDKKLVAQGYREASAVKLLVNYKEFTNEKEAIDYLKKEEEDCIKRIKAHEKREELVHKDTIKDFNKKFPKIEEAVNTFNETGDIKSIPLTIV